MLADDLAAAKRAVADELLRVGPVLLLRRTLENDPVTFGTLVLHAIGALEAARLGPTPSDAELEWVGRELMALLRGETEGERTRGPNRPH